jgi:hypothetical protein
MGGRPRLAGDRRLDHCGGEGMSREFCVIVGGKPSDAPLHEPILGNPAAEALISRQAVERAMRRGLTRKQAERLYR